MKKQSKSKETLGILAHLQKNIPQPDEEKNKKKEFPEDEEDEDNWEGDLLKPKPPTKIMGTN